MKVLVLGDDTRSFLTIVRSLGRRGVAVHVAPRRWSAPALASRHIAARHELPAWSDGEAAWLSATRALLAAERFDLVIPCDETALLPLARHRAVLEPLSRLAIPDDQSIAVLFDKHATRVLAQALGVPVPPGRLPRAEDTAAAVAGELGLPVMVKPRRSFVLEGLDRRQMVSMVTDAATLDAALAEADPDAELLEGFVPGRGLGLSVLAHEGRVLQAFQHNRVHEDASGSYFRVSAPPQVRYLVAVGRMLHALSYTGVAMFEFRADPTDGAWVLLEVNARPWGSMPLAVHAGVDFPWAWFRLMTSGEVLPAMGYREGLYGRNLVPDLRAIMGGLRRTPWAAACRLVGLVGVLLGRERHDVLTWDDPKPGLLELERLGGSFRRQALAAVPGIRALVRWRARGAARTALERPGEVLFVCQGNICRSPFAEAVMRRAWPERGTGSAGLLARPGRPTPAPGVRAAAACGIDLSAHRSRFLSQALAESAALIVVFDRINIEWLQGRYPELATPVVMLGDILGAGELEDPVDGDEPVFAESYRRIEALIRALAALGGR
jgi:protein-tyrosine-phosphatase/predicted ATP-grasp superfamily ATP-dependent carboligase